jgi:hypothetical protein
VVLSAIVECRLDIGSDGVDGISVQDHLLELRNGRIKPDRRGAYVFGHSLPIEQSKLQATVRRLVKDLSLKAGGGPICESPLSHCLL